MPKVSPTLGPNNALGQIVIEMLPLRPAGGIGGLLRLTGGQALGPGSLGHLAWAIPNELQAIAAD